MPTLLAIAVCSLFIAAVEWLLWTMFQRRVAGLIFPRETDASAFRLFRLSRIRLMTIVHALTLIIITDIFLFLLW